MELLLISGYTAICIAVFTLLRIPLNRWTVPTVSIGGAVLIFALVQLLNYYHPYSGMSRQYLTSTPTTPDITRHLSMTNEEQNLVAWFHQNALFRLNDGNAAEVTFNSIPGKVFSGKVLTVLPVRNEDHARAQDNIFDPAVATSQPRILVLINITDPSYARYSSQIPGGSLAQTAIYGEQFHQLALVRKTLLRMSSWMNYLSLAS